MKKLIAIVMCMMMLVGGVALAEGAKPLEGQKLSIALSPNFMYFETVSETEECGYEGLDIDIIKEFSKMLGFEFEIIPMSFSSLVGSLQAGSVDMVISGMAYTAERDQVVDFSNVYCTTSVGCVTKVDSAINTFDDLQNQIVCCSQGTNYEMLIESIPGATLKTFQGQAAVGTAVAEGADGVVAGLTSINGSKKLANTMFDAEGKPMLKYFALEDAPADEYSMAFPEGSELVAIFNTALAELQKSGKLDEMIKHWLY
ncbi:MAG: amino acid ABC transporter substrate-binding protein [Clostridia bacterium]|nr:amino acid ABC transporter substrate-binding protein [Clostridia bacterium]